MEKEEWISYRNWIELMQNYENISIEDSIRMFFKTQTSLEKLGLQLNINSEKEIGESIFYVIEPHYVKQYFGYVREENESLLIEQYHLCAQLCMLHPIPIIGRNEDGEYRNPFDAIVASFSSEKAYIINSLDKSYKTYYLEKDIDGNYMPCMESSHYFKIERKKMVEKVYQILKSDVINK